MHAYDLVNWFVKKTDQNYRDEVKKNCIDLIHVISVIYFMSSRNQSHIYIRLAPHRFQWLTKSNLRKPFTCTIFFEFHRIFVRSQQILLKNLAIGAPLNNINCTGQGKPMSQQYSQWPDMFMGVLYTTYINIINLRSTLTKIYISHMNFSFSNTICLSRAMILNRWVARIPQICWETPENTANVHKSPFYALLICLEERNFIALRVEKLFECRDSFMHS